MSKPNSRFPRSKLLNRAAELQSEIEYWLGEVAVQRAQAQDYGNHHVLEGRLGARYAALQVAREHSAQLRKAIYDVE